MTQARDEIVRKLWRGEDPFPPHRFADGTPDLQGWGSQHQYLTDSIEALRPSVIVEVGVWKGASVIHMASRLRHLGIDGVVIAVDTWMGAWDHWIRDTMFKELGLLDPDRGIFATFSRNVVSAGLADYIVPMPLDSINAAQVMRHFNIVPEIVHIDAGHDYAAVLADLRQWWPLLQPGGLLIGDDYRAGNDWPGVKRAFDDFFRPLALTPLENTNEKCRVFKPLSDARADQLWSRMLTASSVFSAWREARRLEIYRLLRTENRSLVEQLDGYIRFTGPNWNEAMVRLQDQITLKLKAGSRGAFFGPHGDLKTTVVRASVPDFNANYLLAAECDGFQKFELLHEFDNRFAQSALPSPLDKNMSKTKAPALVAHRAEACDLFLTGAGYQLFRADEGIFWPAASTRAYPREAMECPHVTVEKPVVLVQDAFEGSNFAHFLFDWIPRLGHFLNAGIEDPSSCIFVMGGIPGEFHFRIIQAICAIYEVDQEQFVFPAEPQIWHGNGPIYFFSDFKKANTHPANMAHRRSIALVREVCARIRTEAGDIKRMYISRGDTPLRRLANEADLLHELRAFGFMEVQLASLPLLEQVKLVRGADVIVAPHGMGLTHIAFHEGRPLIVELHNASIGTDTYTFIAHALGFKYRAILGTTLGGMSHHFNVLPRDVIDVLTEEGMVPLPIQGAATSRIQGRFLAGVQSVEAVEVAEISPLKAETAVYKHRRDDVTVQPDSNTGWLEVSGMVEGAIYHCACDVWLPACFDVSRITFDSSLIAQSAWPADLEKRDQWQTIRVNGTAAEGLANFVLRCDAASGEPFYSSGWRVGPGTDIG